MLFIIRNNNSSFSFIFFISTLQIYIIIIILFTNNKSYDYSLMWIKEFCKLFSIIHFNLVFPTQYLINKCVFFLSKMLIYRHNYNPNIDNKAIRPLDAKRSAIIAMIGVISIPPIGGISCLNIFK